LPLKLLIVSSHAHDYIQDLVGCICRAGERGESASSFHAAEGLDDDDWDLSYCRRTLSPAKPYEQYS
jgi:hypothetical protein